MEVITYEIQQQVKVRKYNVDCKKLCDLLRKHKKMASLSNKEIAETLNMPITKVEHWFRQDSCFSIPDECIWFELKKLLKITNNEFDLAITTFEEKDNVFEKGNRIYDSDGICPTITCADADITILDRSNRMEVIGSIYTELSDDFQRGIILGGISRCVKAEKHDLGVVLMEEERIGGLYDGETKHQAGSVWDKEKLCPTLTNMQGGCRQPMIIENIPCSTSRVNKGEFTSSQDLKLINVGQEEAGTILSRYWKGIEGDHSNTIIVAMRGRNPTNPSDRTPGIETEQRLEPNTHGTCNTLTSVQKDNLVMEKVKIKQATKQGYIECELGGVADLSYPNSNTRRGRVQDNGQVSPTLTAGEQDICRIEKEVDCEEGVSVEILRIFAERNWRERFFRVGD